MSLEGYTATFSTGWTALGLPWEVAANFVTALDFENLLFMPPSVACERRAEMPDISINLAGHDFVLSAYDYTYEWPMERGEVRCVAAFAGFEFEHQEKMIVLGSSFLRAFYTVFDLEYQSVGCKSISNKTLERLNVLTLASRKTIVTQCLSAPIPISMEEDSNQLSKRFVERPSREFEDRWSHINFLNLLYRNRRHSSNFHNLIDRPRPTENLVAAIILAQLRIHRSTTTL